MDIEIDKALSQDASTEYDETKIEALVPLINTECFHPNKRRRVQRSVPLSPLITRNAHSLLAVLARDMDPRDLASLEMTCKYFRKPAGLCPEYNLSVIELAALDMCQKRTLFKLMTKDEKEVLKKRCGGSWKLVLQFLLTGERCTRRGKCQAIAGPGHSVVVTPSGVVYSFGYNNYGQLGNGTTEDEWKPRLIRSIQGNRIINAAVGGGLTILVSDTGCVFAFGRDSFKEAENEVQDSDCVTNPKLVESLEGIFVVQATIGHYFTAVLSREGRVYTLCWGADAKLGHKSDSNDWRPHLLKGAIVDIPVVQIAAGNCYLLALAFQPSGMSVYSVGCGQGGKLGHGSKSDEQYPLLIEHFQTLNLQPHALSAGVWHAAVVGKDGRVCTWGWGNCGCLGHGNEECQTVPKVIEAFEGIKAVNVAAGDYTTFVVADNGDVYSFGYGESSLGHSREASENQDVDRQHVFYPQLVASFQQRNEQVVHISTTNSVYWDGHTFALTRTGKIYVFGMGNKGQLGVNLPTDLREVENPEHLDIDLT